MLHWEIWWGFWAGLFVVSEGIALFNKTSGDTLSETVWNWLRGRKFGDSSSAMWGVRALTWNHNTWRTYAVGAFLLWLFFHLTFGWFSG